MPPQPRPRTLLAHLLVERHWTVEDFCRHYATAAATINADTYGITERQAKRWLAGTVTRPYPVARRVLETMFGIDTDVLLSPTDQLPERDPALPAQGGMVPVWIPRDDGHAPTAEEASPTDRRHALRLLALGPAAAELSHRIARADPDPLTLDQYEADLHHVADTYRTTPHATLAATVGTNWQTVEGVLDARVSPRVRGRMTLLAGNFAFYLGTLAFDLADDRSARSFFHVAAQHADEARDLLPATTAIWSDVALLAGSVAAMRSSLAYFTGAHAQAADIAAAARHGAHPFTRPILAGCEARAAALSGRPEDARAALTDLQEHVWQGGILPGPNPGDAGFANGFLAVTLAHLGDGHRAEQHARIGLDAEIAAGPGHYVQIGGTYNSLCRAYLRRTDPDPEQAADAATRALTILDGRPTRSVIQQAAQMWQEMDARWPELPAVRELGEIVTASRRALPAAQAV
ncbi:XRE family transcriptional regulator [Frankia sp. CNm7]|uniref:XRE family transcriptional regulator n=1 Tax=Frankia nepalensis TaxID=1836974 RepID=A0A937UK86_9ACTN|nr:XRE family transcriptional regulator [Frankia nepalensis]MBL7494868.1 XRE family transcriptional regulator [Frankia nepalensis]MBL7512222.1 XRE family transcriptional regulator [Frankia nepalensis]MBL7516906.1 XRE family transcriptional regulator [Frankia nepalensis]MBL7626564.1 XRE family transcriptional regulator [Frankia nepalensis]